MEVTSQPLVSIGLPVFNGEAGLARALESLIDQDYRNLEIIVTDNASTDRTAEITEEFMRRDSRIRYFRQHSNVGSVGNFNKAVELAEGKYFLWAAHDDVRHPAFVGACVQVLEEHPDAVLCHSHTRMEVEGETLGIVTLDSFTAPRGTISQYRETLRAFPAAAVYGMYRLEAMRKTRLLTRSIATDIAFIQELSVYGRFVQVPTELFRFLRRKRWNTIHEDYRVFFGKPRKPWWYLPFVALFVNNFRRIATCAHPLHVRAMLLGVLIWSEATQLSIKVLTKAIRMVCPSRLKKSTATWIYWHLRHNPNIQVKAQDLYYTRVILPTLGWDR